MFGMRKFAVNGARIALRRNGAASAGSFRSMSSLLDSKERGEEAIYFQHEDARLKHEMRMKMEKILELDDDHEEKKELVDLLKKKEEEAVVDPNQSLLDKMGLTDWRIAAPVGALVAIPLLAHEVITIGAETQLAAMFALFVGTCHKSLGPVASKFFNDAAAEIAKDLKKVDENQLIEVKKSIDEHEQLLSLDKDLSNVIHLRDDLAIVQADILNHQEQHKFRDAIQRKLDALVAAEEAASTAIRGRMITQVRDNVVKEFQNDSKSKDDALAAAVSILSSGVGAKRGKDVVGNAFSRAIASYRTEYQKSKPGDDPIIVQFEKDVAAIGKAPEISFAATNVYESHPLGGQK